MEYVRHNAMVRVFDGRVPAPYKIRIENLTLNTVEEHSNETNSSISFANRLFGFYRMTLDDRDEITFYHGERYEIKISEQIEDGKKVFSVDTPIKLSEGRLYIKLSDYNFRFFFPGNGKRRK